MRSRKIIVVFLCALLLCLAGCHTSGREYRDDVVVELGTDEKLIIREWSFLMGGGAEIYYQHGDQKPVLLGQTGGGDDGACPFSLGQYEITRDGNTVLIKWQFRGDVWHSQTFELPN